MELLILGAAAFATSILSAVVGMAGGITLLAVMLLFLDPLVAIPIHGVVQLVSNGSRAWLQRAHVDRSITWRFGLLLLPAGWLGLEIAQAIPPEGLRAAIGGFVLVATWWPAWLLLGIHPERSTGKRRFVVLGGLAGVLNTTIGATGPLIAPFFLDLGLSRFQLVGTKAACQLLGHVAKIAIFGLAGFAFGLYGSTLLVLCALVVVGTAIGTRILDRVNERLFVALYKGVLTLIAIHLVARELWGIAWPA
ncbi:MAG: sulfite exporter TauE/SafE family protein [Myxococcota bacterium]